MSRLYDALKEATRFRKDANGNAGEQVWDALGINGEVIPPAPNGPEPRETNRPADELAAVPTAVPVEPPVSAPVVPEAVVPEEDAIHAVLASSNGWLGTTAVVALDRHARLIPHAVDPVVVEHYRRLRTKIIQQQEEKRFRSLVVTSASPQEGKTVTVLNLGLSFAMLPSFKVLVVDGDLRRGTLGNWLGVDGQRPGLSNLIDGTARLEDVVMKSDEIPMHFMVRGNSQVPDLHGSQLDRHFKRMSQEFDLVLVDSPPVNLIADVQLLAAGCDAVLMIARAFSTTRKTFEKAVQDLSPFRLIGTVLNGGTAQHYRYHGYY